MIYKIKAKFNQSRANDFFEKLIDGSIKNQQPDGQEIVASMKRAKVTQSGFVEWFEKCFCSTPLQHERATIYDQYFSEMFTEPVEDYGNIEEGEFFWAYLQSKKEQIASGGKL